jgi:hypothetical protein
MNFKRKGGVDRDPGTPVPDSAAWRTHTAGSGARIRPFPSRPWDPGDLFASMSKSRPALRLIPDAPSPGAMQHGTLR